MPDSVLIENLKSFYPDNTDIIDLMKYDLEQCIYYYGDQFKSPRERASVFAENTRSRRVFDFKPLAKIMKKAVRRGGSREQTFSPGEIQRRRRVLSNGYFSFNEELARVGLNPLRYLGFGTNSGLNEELSRDVDAVLGTLSSPSIAEIVRKDTIATIRKLRERLLEHYLRLDVQALIVPYDVSFLERLMLDVFRKLQRPSFIFLHGLPGRYNIYDENRSDYLIVWGQKIKEAYVKAGHNSDRIIVSGHPYYSRRVNREIQFGLANILVITKSMSGAQASDMCRLSDRGNLISYLYSIQRVLMGFGVKTARLRPHPSENGAWYMRHVDGSFYTLDHQDLVSSLEKATLVIGSTSTVLLESAYYGANYLVFEPIVNGLDLVGFPLVPPFDGSDSRVPVANDENQLRELIGSRIRIDNSFFTDYVKQPFDISWINEVISMWRKSHVT